MGAWIDPKVGGHDSDDYRARTGQCLAENTFVGSEAAPPKTIAENDVRIPAVFRQKRAAHDRLHIQYSKHV